MPDQRLRELDDPDGDAAPVHEFPGQHEERDRHEREAVHAVVDVAVEQRDVLFLPREPEQDAGCGDQPEEDREPDRQEQQEGGEEPDQHVAPYSAMISSSGGPRSARSSPPPRTVMSERRNSSTLTTNSRTTPTKNDIIIHRRGTFTHSRSRLT